MARGDPRLRQLSTTGQGGQDVLPPSAVRVKRVQHAFWSNDHTIGALQRQGQRTFQDERVQHVQITTLRAGHSSMLSHDR